MRSSFTGVTFTPGLGVSVWSRGRKVRTRRRPRHLHLSGERGRALCGVFDRATVHKSKARRTDCERCRAIARAEVWRGRAESFRDLARRTEFREVAQRLSRDAGRAERRVRLARIGPPEHHEWLEECYRTAGPLDGPPSPQAELRRAALDHRGRP